MGLYGSLISVNEAGKIKRIVKKALGISKINKNDIKKSISDKKENKDNRIKNMELISAEKNLYQTNSTVDGCKVKVMFPSMELSYNADTLNNINITIKQMDDVFEEVCKIVLSSKTKWPEDAINKQALGIVCKDVLVDMFMDNNGFYTMRARCLVKTFIKDIDEVVLGIIINTKDHITNVSWWDKWPL